MFYFNLWLLTIRYILKKIPVQYNNEICRVIRLFASDSKVWHSVNSNYKRIQANCRTSPSVTGSRSLIKLLQRIETQSYLVKLLKYVFFFTYIVTLCPVLRFFFFFKLFRYALYGTVRVRCTCRYTTEFAVLLSKFKRVLIYTFSVCLCTKSIKNLLHSEY